MESCRGFPLQDSDRFYFQEEYTHEYPLLFLPNTLYPQPRSHA
jgi:hypothetical protein